MNKHVRNEVYRADLTDEQDETPRDGGKLTAEKTYVREMSFIR